MALTIAEQIDLINDDLIADGYKLSDFILQISINQIEDFYLNKKIFDGATYPLAQSYVDKMDFVMKNIKEKPFWTLRALIKIMVGIMANTITPTQVSNATTDQWSNFLESNILKCFEILAGAYNEEKAEYDAIVVTP